MMARKRAKGLTERQKRILEVLERFQDQNGYPPSIREICDLANISSTSVVKYYLSQLEEGGYIERDGRVSRGIRVLKPLSGMAGAAAAGLKGSAARARQAVEELLRIPMVGRIAAGTPVPVPASDFSYYDADSMVDVAQSMLPNEKDAKDLFALEVKGDSMIDAMVFDGDIVIMRPAREARNGEMVAVWLNDKDETTLKYFYLEKGKVRLQPANPNMQAIVVDDPSTVEIQGKVVMVIRQVGGRPA
ncbi:MAG TPA: transcriptional repressor LexA [Anaerolineales bacterium]|nr:transcriptional repressor LexA [Anaerolineales bacterium]